MNAAFLLVTTAWFAGADPAPTTTTAPAGTTAGPVASVPLAGGVGYGGGYGCGGGAYAGGCGNECCGKVGCLQKLRNRCHHRNNNCCCESFGSYGNTGCGNVAYTGNVGGCGSNYGGCGSNNCGCGSNYGNNCCQTSCRQGLCARLKGRFHRNNCCCESGWDGCGGYGAGVGGVGGVAPGVMPGTAEPIKTLPKDATTPGNKLPSGKSGGTVQSHGMDLTPASSPTPSF